MNDVDVLVVGAGPVGLAAAIEARMSGLSVTVVEPREGAIDKACGEGLMPGALPLLARLGVDPVGRSIAGISYRDATRRADHLFRQGQGRGVRRTTLQEALAARAAELGVERLIARVDELHQDAYGVTAAGIRAGWLLGCDGLHSTVSKHVGLDRRSSGVRRFGIRRHVAVAPWSDLVEVHWTPRAEVYVTPVADDTVGIAVLGPVHTDFDEVLAGIPELADRLAGASFASSLRGAGPLRRRTSARTAGRVLLVGDASGYVDAITGEGLRVGFDQARAAISAVREGDAARYERRWRSITRDFRVLTDGLVRAANSPLRGAIVPAASALPGLYGSIVERLAR